MINSECVDKNVQETRLARYQTELGRAERQARELHNGILPGIPEKGKPGAARGMPKSLNPNETAKKFAETFLGRKPKPIELVEGAKLYGGKCIGCWKAQMPDGTFVVYRPAGNASSMTKGTTASVDINSPNRLNNLNINLKGKPTELKFKFPAQ